MKILKTLVVSLILLALSACVTSGDLPKEPVSSVNAARANFELGMGYFKKNKLPLAYDKFRRSIEHDPSNAQVHAFLALVAAELDETEEAQKHYLEAIRLDQKDPAVQNMYGAFLCKAGDYAQAEQHFLSAANNRFYSTPEAAYANAGSCLLKNQEYEKALGYLNSALRLNAKYTLALWSMAQLHYEQNRDLQARTFLERIGDKEVLPPEALLLGYQISQRAGERSHMQEYGQQLRQRYPDSIETTTLLELERNGG